MARLVLNSQVVDSTGIDATVFPVNSTTYQFKNWGTGKDLILMIQNDSTAGLVVTIPTPPTVLGDLAVGDRIITVPASSTRYISDFNPAWFNQRGANAVSSERDYVYVNFDSTADMYTTLLET